MPNTRERIDTAAMRLFAQRGTLELTMSELATEAGLARGTLYRNVDSMEKLFERVRQTLASELHGAIAATMDSHGELDPPLRQATGLRMIVRLAHENQAMGRFIVRFGMTDESLQGMLAGPPLIDLRAGRAAGRYDYRPELELSVVSMVIGTTLSAIWMVLEGHQGWREAGSKAAELVLIAAGVDPKQARTLSEHPLPEMTNS